jgi:sugar phosphate isomerase/epimerase
LANIKFGIDTITLYSPKYWDQKDWWAFQDPDCIAPEKFWDRALDTVAMTGASGLRLSFGPAQWRHALKRYGTPEKFQDAIHRRALELAGVLFVEMGRGNMFDPTRREQVIEEMRQCADFVKAAGGGIIAMGLPARKTWSENPPLVVDLEYAKYISDMVNEMGYETLKRGVKLALHPKTHGTFWLKRDIDLFMMLTDPIYVFFCPDTAHITLGGGDPVRILDEHRYRVIMNDWKDARRALPWHYTIDKNHLTDIHPHYAFVGEGIVDWKAWVNKLKEIGYTGWSIVELDATDDPVVQTKQAFKYIQDNLKSIYS